MNKIYPLLGLSILIVSLGLNGCTPATDSPPETSNEVVNEEEVEPEENEVIINEESTQVPEDSTEAQ